MEHFRGDLCVLVRAQASGFTALAIGKAKVRFTVRHMPRNVNFTVFMYLRN